MKPFLTTVATGPRIQDGTIRNEVCVGGCAVLDRWSDMHDQVPESTRCTRFEENPEPSPRVGYEVWARSFSSKCQFDLGYYEAIGNA